jgi:hypothetical protein
MPPEKSIMNSRQRINADTGWAERIQEKPADNMWLLFWYPGNKKAAPSSMKRLFDFSRPKDRIVEILP